MIELSEDIKQVCEMFEKSGNCILQGLAFQLSRFKPDKKYVHVNKETFVCHDAWEMDRLLGQKCKKTLTMEKANDTKVLKTYYETPKQEIVNDATLILGKNGKGNDCGWLKVKIGKDFKQYSFSCKKGFVENFKETKQKNPAFDGGKV